MEYIKVKCSSKIVAIKMLPLCHEEDILSIIEEIRALVAIVPYMTTLVSRN